jgi:hypothetical protein
MRWSTAGVQGLADVVYRRFLSRCATIVERLGSNPADPLDPDTSEHPSS